MTKINLRDYYPHYQKNCFVEVPNEVVAFFHEFELDEAAYKMRTYRNKAYYSLDRGDGIEHDILLVSLSPYEIYERKLTMKQLYAAIAHLPDKQAKRVYAHYFMELSVSEIAKAEGISERAVYKSIEVGLRNLAKFAKSSF